MHLKTKNLKLTNKLLAALVLCIGLTAPLSAQDTIAEDTSLQKVVKDTIIQQRFKADGIAAVIGTFVVLDSDIEKMYLDLKSQGVDTENITSCELAGRMFENKLYAHHAIQDSIVIADAEINARIEQQFDYMVRELGSVQKVLEFYNKDSESEFKQELFQINKEGQLASRMQAKIVKDVEITPEEVRAFFRSIPEGERPLFGDEVEIAQIVVKPKVSEESKAEVIARLNEFRKDILENGASFATKAVLYSKDPGSRSDGGKISLSRKDPFVKEFKDAAFSLQEGEVSKPFETEFGFHILTVDKIRGQQVDVRHILLLPEISDATVAEAKEKIELIKKRIEDNELSFEEAAMEFSDEKETKFSGGQLINPQTGDTRFELTKVDPIIYEQVMNLEEGEISTVIKDQDRTGTPSFKLVTVTERHKEHIADYVQDYSKIKNLALTEKQIKEIQKWQTEKINDTYIKVNGKFRNCDFESNWVKK